MYSFYRSNHFTISIEDQTLLAAVSGGEITPSEAAEIGRLLETYVRTLEITELEQRLNKLEGIMTNEGN